MGILQINIIVMMIEALIQISQKNKKVRDAIFYLMCAQLLFLAVFKSPEYGVDSVNYTVWFLQWREMPLLEVLRYYSTEPGYILINKIIGFFTDDVTIFYGLIAVLTLIPQFIFIKKYSMLPGLALVAFTALGFHEFSMSILRQALALAIYVWGFKYISERKFWKYALFVFLAFCFHQTAAITIFLYFLYPWKNTFGRLLGSFGASLALFLFAPWVLPILNRLAGKNYVLNYEAGRTLYILLWVLAFAFFFIGRKRMNNPSLKVHYDALNIAAVFQSFSMVMESFGRAIQYYQISLVILIPDVVYYIGLKEKKNQAVFVPLYLLLCVVFYLYYNIAGINVNRVYSFLWS